MSLIRKVLCLALAVALLSLCSVSAFAVEYLPVGFSYSPYFSLNSSDSNSFWVDGTYSFLSGRATSNNGSSWSNIGSNKSFNIPSGSGIALQFWGTSLSDPLPLLSSQQSYLLSFRGVLPSMPQSVSVRFFNEAGSLITLPINEFSYFDNELLFDFVFSPPEDCSFAVVYFYFGSNLTSSFSGSMTTFSLTNLSTMAMDDDNWRNKGFSPDRVTLASSGENGGYRFSKDFSTLPSSVLVDPPVEQDVFHNFDISLSAYYDDLPSLSGNYLYHLKFNVLRPNGFSELNIHDVDFGAAQVRVSYVPNVSGDNDNMAYVDVWGVVPLTGYGGTNAANIKFGMSSQQFGDFETAFTVSVLEWDFYPASEVSSLPMVAGEDAPFAAWIGSFFSNMYNSLIGFFISQEADTEKDFDDSYKPENDQAILDAQDQIDKVEQFEDDIFGQADQGMSDLNPSQVQAPSSIVSTMAWISNIWTSSFNVLPKDFQFVLTFPLFLGISLLMLGRGVHLADGPYKKDQTIYSSGRILPDDNRKIGAIDVKYKEIE